MCKACKREATTEEMPGGYLFNLLRTINTLPEWVDKSATERACKTLYGQSVYVDDDHALLDIWVHRSPTGVTVVMHVRVHGKDKHLMSPVRR